MKRLWAFVFLMAMASSAIADNIDYRALLLRFFTTNIPSAKYVGLNTNTVVTFGSIDTNYLSTNGFVIQINTNLNSSFYQFITNIVQGSPRVWTNDPAFKDLFESNTIHPILRSEIRFGMGDGSLFLFGTSNGPSRLVIYNPNEPITSSPAPFENTDIGTRSLNIYNPDIGGVGQLNSVEIYAYKPNGTNDRAVASVLAFTADPGIAYGDGVLLDPFGDSGETSAFRFSSAYSNSIPANEDLFEIQNGHTNKFVLAGNGDLYWGADATVGYRPPTTNALPGQVWASSGGTPQQLYWTNLPAGGGGTAQDLWRTNPVEGGIWWSNAPQVAKFGSYTSGFVAGQTNSGGTVEAQFGFGAIGLGYATGSGSLITSEGNGSLTYGETSAGGLIEGDGNGSTAAGYSTGSGSTINSIADGSFAGGKADLGGKVLAENTATASMVYGYSSAGLLRCLGSSTFLFGEADGAGSVMDNNGLGTLMVGRANHGGTFLAHGSGGITSGYVDFGGNLDDGGALGSIANAFVTGTNSKSFNYPYGSLFTSAVREAGDVIFGVNQVVYQEGCLGAVAVNSAGIVRMNPAVGCFIGGLATSTNLLSANGTNTFTFGKNVGNTGDYAYSFGRDYTNSTPESFNVGWGSNVLQVTKTDLSVNGTINASLNSTLGGNQTSVTSGMASTTLSVTLTAGKTYTFQAELFLSDSTAADGAKIDFGGGSATATTFIAQVTAFDTALNLSSQLTSLTGVASASTFTGAGAFEVHGTIFVNQGGTLIPRFAQVNHSIGTLTLAKGSFIRFIQTP